MKELAACRACRAPETGRELSDAVGRLAEQSELMVWPRRTSSAPITDLDAWELYGAPRDRARQWRDGGSAKELARLFLRDGHPAVPAAVRRLLSPVAALRTVRYHSAFPELSIRPRAQAVESRPDLMLLGSRGRRRVLVTIEAKAGEGFGPTVGGRFWSAVSARSRLPGRIDTLADEVLGRPLVDPVIGGHPYQLLAATGSCAAEAAAREAALAVLIIVQFRDPTIRAQATRNIRDFNAFAETVIGRPQRSRGSELTRRVHVPVIKESGERVHVPLILGKLVVRLPAGD